MISQSMTLKLHALSDTRLEQKEFIWLNKETDKELELYFTNNKLTTDHKEKKKQLDEQKIKDNYITISKTSETLESDIITTNLSNINWLRKDKLVSELID